MTDVASHYSHGGLIERIGTALAASGVDRAHATTVNLAPVDEFHIRGRPATLEIAEHMNLHPNAKVLDLGSGLGGAARTIAEIYDCHVSGVDLTPEFCDCAQELSHWTGLDNKTCFTPGDATALPYEDNTFDAAMTIHVAMNIGAKDKLYAEAYRVLKPGAMFAIYDVMQGNGGNPIFPVPWAKTPDLSFLSTPDEVRDLLEGVGFSIEHIHDSSAESLDWFIARAKALGGDKPPPITPALILGADFATMAGNQVQNLREDRIRTVSIIAKT